MEKQFRTQGQKLASIRALHGDTLESLATKLGVTKSYLSKLENGHKPLTEEVFKKLEVTYALTFEQASDLANSNVRFNIKLSDKGIRMQSKKDTQDLVPLASDFQVALDPGKTPILYTDVINVYTNGAGVVLNIGQSSGPTTQVQVVTRIGLSHVHAKQLHEALGKNLKAYFESQGMEY